MPDITNQTPAGTQEPAATPATQSVENIEVEAPVTPEQQQQQTLSEEAWKQREAWLKRQNEEAIAKALAEQEAKAKMDADQLKDYEMQKLIEERDLAIAEKTAMENKDTTIKELDKHGLPRAFSEFMDFYNINMGTMPEQVSKINEAYRAAIREEVAKATNNAAPPTQVAGGGGAGSVPSVMDHKSF